MSVVRRLRDQRGYSLVEMLTVMIIMGVVLGGITALFVQGSNAEVEMNTRFQAQLDARVAMDRLRREVHCAQTISPSGPTNSVTITLPSTCKVATGAVTWCAVSVSGNTRRYRLYRSAANPCGDSADGIYADYLDLNNGTVRVFNHTVQSSASLGKLAVNLPVDVKIDKPGSYTLQDTLVMRNTTRTCITGSPSPPC